MRIENRETREKRKVDNWNTYYPPGTPVIVTLDNGEKLTTTTRSRASLMCGKAMVWVDGLTACYWLGKVEPISPKNVLNPI